MVSNKTLNPHSVTKLILKELVKTKINAHFRFIHDINLFHERISALLIILSSRNKLLWLNGEWFPFNVGFNPLLVNYR